MAIERVTTGKALESGMLHGPGVISSGRILHTSGMVARDADGAMVGVGDMKAQLAQVLRNLADVIEAAGADFSRVIKFTIYVTDMEEYQRVREIGNVYYADKPAATLVEVSRLASSEMMVEIEAVVALD
jgi:enamine deaminase RidA (YjgF/YER057c/UK114 family)